MVASSSARDFLHILPNPTNMLDLHQLLLIHLAQMMKRTGPPRHTKKRRYRLWTRKLREFKILQTRYKPNNGDTFKGTKVGIIEKATLPAPVAAVEPGTAGNEDISEQKQKML